MSYVYTVARLRGMENHLLDGAFFSRLMDSASIDDAVKALGETSYSQWISQSSGVNFDKAIDAEILATCEELKSFVPDKELLDIFRLPYDFHNVKVLLKGLFKVRGGDTEGRRYDLISKLGTIDTEELTNSIETEEYGFLPYGLTDLIPACWTLWDQTKNAQAVELLIDHAMFKAMLNVAENLKMPDIIQWVKFKIDAENLRAAIRLARMKYDPAKSLPFFHEGGTIRPDDMAKLLNEPQETWSRILSYTDIGSVLGALSEQSDMKAALSDVSKALDDYLLKVLEKAKYSMDSPANVLLFLLTKEAEARNMRVALVCVAGGLDREFGRRLLSNGR
ncbi:MAG: V-type ATPase subunit [Synergistaceae bacterium]|nr:V-type ATPase subunit [Synergistaceae bacterium]